MNLYFYVLTLFCALNNNNNNNNNFSKKKFINNEDIPICSQCVHFVPRFLFPYPGPSDLSKCKKFGDKNIVTGRIRYEYANDCRENTNKCGKEGKFYEEK